MEFIITFLIVLFMSITQSYVLIKVDRKHRAKCEEEDRQRRIRNATS